MHGVIWSINDIRNDDYEEQNLLTSSTRIDENSDNIKGVRIADYLDPNTDNLPSATDAQVIEEISSSKNEQIIEPILDDLKRKKDEIESAQKIERRKVEKSYLSSKESANDAQILADTLYK